MDERRRLMGTDAVVQARGLGMWTDKRLTPHRDTPRSARAWPASQPNWTNRATQNLAIGDSSQSYKSGTTYGMKILAF